MANHTYSKGLLYKKTLNSSGEVTGSVPLLLKTLGSLVIMSDGTDAETAISTAISNMVTPDETTIVTGQDGITISVKKSTSAEIDEILGDVPTEHTWEGYYTKSEVNTLVGAVDAKFNQNDIETALGYTPIASSTKGSANGVASLDANGLVPSAQLPSYVDDVIESATFAALPATGETGKIYVTLNDNKTYRWSGSAYVEISQSLALGETSSTAFAGDKGKTAYEHVSDTTKHVPTGGTNAQYLKNTGNNTYAWASPDSSWPTTPTNNTIPGNKLVDDRFKVNETNILYSLNTGVKNVLPIKFPDRTVYGVTLINNNDGSIRVNGTNSQSSGTILLANIQSDIYTDGYSDLSNFLGKNKDYVLVGNTTTANLKIQVLGWNSSSDNSIIASSSTDAVSFNTSTWNYIAIRLWAAASAAFSNVTITPMICTADAWAQSHDYQPPALPNYDLTRLEAEDRAALAEEIDAGAKNKLNYDAWKTVAISNGTAVWENNGVTLTASGDDCYTAYNPSSSTIPASMKIPVKQGDVLVMSWEYEIASGVTAQAYIFPNGVVTGSVIGLIADKKLIYTVPSGVTYVTYRVGVRGTGNVAKWKNVMICTKAAFGVSTKFVPYTKSNSQLTTELGSVKTVLEAIL